MSSISCSCEKCKLFLTENQPIMSLFCACKDCIQAIKWGHLNGGRAPEYLSRAVYIRLDIIYVEGEKHMKPFQLREHAKSTRVYCTSCYSILGVSHPTYSNNVFMFFPHHCESHLDLSIEPCAAIHMSSYNHGEKADISIEIPVFYNWDYPQERERFFSIPGVKKSFTKPSNSPAGRTFNDLINSLAEVEVLNFEIGSEPTKLM